MEQEAADLHYPEIYDELVTQGVLESFNSYIWAH